jgi:hypothetical protein
VQDHPAGSAIPPLRVIPREGDQVLAGKPSTSCTWGREHKRVWLTLKFSYELPAIMAFQCDAGKNSNAAMIVDEYEPDEI